MTTTFPFRFSPAYRVTAAVFGVRPASSRVEITDGTLTARFGPWTLQTDIANIKSCSVTGNYGRLKTMGPAHLSLVDKGLTFASNRDRGLCIQFKEPVPGIDPLHRIQHPGLTVTVTDVTGLRDSLVS